MQNYVKGGREGVTGRSFRILGPLLYLWDRWR